MLLSPVAGVFGQDETFSVVPKASNIVPAGEQVVLECVTREPVVCAWKLSVPELDGTGFLISSAVRGQRHCAAYSYICRRTVGNGNTASRMSAML